MRTWRNTYWLLRHGRSAANERDLIVAHLANGELPQWGLTDEGRSQAAAAGEQLHALLAAAQGGAASANGGSDSGAVGGRGSGSGSGSGGTASRGAVHFLASPFSRALETAQGAMKALGTGHGNLEIQVSWLAGWTGWGGGDADCGCGGDSWAAQQATTTPLATFPALLPPLPARAPPLPHIKSAGFSCLPPTGGARAPRAQLWRLRDDQLQQLPQGVG